MYSGLSGYSAACQKALKQKFDIELFVSHWPSSENAPFQSMIYEHIDNRFEKSEGTVSKLLQSLQAFAPDAILTSGWMDQDYLRICRFFKKMGIPIIASSDTQWTGRMRQQVARFIAPWYLHSAFDVLWVTGERQKQLAYRLGFRGQKCWEGFYACDWQTFNTKASVKPREKAFLFVGRYIPRKGVSTLIEAYQLYRARANNPWDLWMVGAGPLFQQIEGQSGIQDKGFIQPQELPALMQTTSCFIMPSKVEPWGVAIQEAAAAGLPIICSDACGAGVHLVRNNFNGRVFQVGNHEELAICLEKMSNTDSYRWVEWSRNSIELSRQYTPEIWARTLMDGIKDLV